MFAAFGSLMGFVGILRGARIVLGGRIFSALLSSKAASAEGFTPASASIEGARSKAAKTAVSLWLPAFSFARSPGLNAMSVERMPPS